MKTLVTIFKETKGKITLHILVDKISDCYLNESNDIKIIDNDFILNQFALLKSVKFLGTHEIKLTAISTNKASLLNKKDNAWVTRKSTPILSGGMFTMLKNKGYL